MIDNISFKNYRIFKDNQVLEIKPITIIFGKNNTGKSAILKLPIFIESSIKSITNEVFELKCQEIELGAEMRDIIYGKASRAMEFTLTDADNTYKLYVKFFIDSTAKEQQSKIEKWHLDFQGTSIDITLDNDSYIEENNIITNISFMGIKPIGNNIPNLINQLFEKIDFNIDYIGPIRENPARDIRISPVMNIKSGTKGEYTYQKLISSALTIDKDLINKVSNWYFSNFDEWSITIDKTREPVYHIEIENNSIKTNILDAGVGIVQSLPIVIRAMEKCSEQTLIIIEEPETHLHPAAHANLGELIFSSTQKDPLKKYFIETHSLNFIMRLRRLVAEGKLNKNNVSLYYVDFEKEETASKLKKIEIKEDGSVDYWPKGVFNEALEEAIAIRDTQLNKMK